MFVERLITSNYAMNLLERSLRVLLQIKKMMLNHHLKLLMQMTFLWRGLLRVLL
ncbi:hypothetical protein MTR67_045339 [Solanum verrucosum]|uniref:Uncharacterized protein n=1 Tax=Solanum verrucosum TaxID=315347 RepID=A0AAF0UUD9_SOLVR|nr:hypothetical protein MTR67_045339 [Solanum verrucosum]